ncbi:ZP domain-containing protein-like [Montipora foliosa]|uniref:ZP domain-containing protein-like n=1 Tax=Montipora foliosa TaxID=591990 RepID=UPI0035F1B979
MQSEPLSHGSTSLHLSATVSSKLKCFDMERSLAVFVVLFSAFTLSAGAESSSDGEMIVNSTAKLGIVCHNEYIEVTVERKNYPGLEANGSHLEDEACVPGFKDKDKVVFKFGLDECKTEQEEDGEAIYYKNKVIAIVKDEDDHSNITRSNTRVLPFQCSYKKKARLSKVQFNPQYTLFVTDAADYGNFTYRMDLYTDKDYSSKVDEFPFLVGIGQKLYLQKSVASGDSKLVLFPDECKATPSPDINAKPDHVIIEKGCPRDKTLEYEYKTSATQRFSMNAFRFKKGYDDVYIHCTLSVCRSDKPDSKCVKGCELDGNNTRKRREIADDYPASLFLGPIKIEDREDNKAVDLPASKATEDSPQMLLFVGLLIGTLGVVTLGLAAAVIFVVRRRGSSRNTTPLLILDAE